MIKIESVYKSFITHRNQLHVLNDIICDIPANSITSILGPSGCGKSTLLNIISGILIPDEGKIVISNKLDGNIGFAFQNDILLPWRNVEKNITISAELIKSKEIDIERINSLIAKFELNEIKSFKPTQLSGGMKQKVAFVRTIFPEPNILLLDEPFSNLDFRTKIELEEYLLKYVKEKPNRCCIFVTHNIDEAVSISDKIIFLSKKPTKVIKEKVINSNSRESLLKFRLSTKYEKLYAEVAEIISDVYENKYI